MPGRVLVETYGCQMNKAESEAIVADLRRDGWSVTDSVREADLVVINTCSVRETAEQRVRGRLGWFRSQKRGRPFTLVLTGCMAERLKAHAIEEYPEIDAVVGTFDKQRILEVIGKIAPSAAPGGGHGATGSTGATSATGATGATGSVAGRYRFSPLHCAGGHRSFLPVMHGCDNFCAYCIVPFVRGREVSRDPAEVLSELAVLARRGTREVTLLGQNVNSYRWEASGERLGFPGLLARVAAAAGPIRWIRFLTSHPRDFSPELLEVIATQPAVCRSIHLPVQSGSDRVLASMNRGYTASHYRRLAERIRARLSGVALTTDILVGFPGETEEDLRATLSLMEDVGFDEAFTYHYNPRPGTAACLLAASEVPERTRLERLERVIASQRRISGARSRARLGAEVDLLVEGPSRRGNGELLARAEWDAMAVLPGGPELVGRFVRARLVGISGTTFRAQPL